MYKKYILLGMLGSWLMGAQDAPYPLSREQLLQAARATKIKNEQPLSESEAETSSEFEVYSEPETSSSEEDVAEEDVASSKPSQASNYTPQVKQKQQQIRKYNKNITSTLIQKNSPQARKIAAHLGVPVEDVQLAAQYVRNSVNKYPELGSNAALVTRLANLQRNAKKKSQERTQKWREQERAKKRAGQGQI